MIELPEIFLKRMKNLLNAEEFSAFCNAYENSPVRGIRYNALKIAKSSSSVPWCKNGFIYDSAERPSKTIAYHAGLFYIQEPSAMCPGEVLGVEPGDKVLDICAAPGGKSVQIAGHLQGQVLLVSNDASASRSRALVKNLERAGVTNAIVLTEMPQKLAARFPSFFDRILVDAPCSGEGMFRRDSDAVKAYTENKPEACAAVQKEILRHAASMLKPGGRMVYSTCTFNTQENEETIAAFLEKHEEFSLVKIEHQKLGVQKGIGITQAARIWPHLAQGEGHFIALMERALPSSNDTVVSDTRAIFNKNKQPREFTEFCNEFLNISFDDKNFVLHGVNLYVQKIPIELKGLRVARSGWFLGEIKKNRFVPSQAMAMGLRKEQARYAVELSEQDAEKYLHGESLHFESPEKFPITKPWVLVCHENFPLGWARLVQGRLKNNLPVGWVI
ncbi:MAG: RsmF rRNA methyltransferase first C-terminal domain-containing protein [Defluviitaleaceae bacterium]|nr:RsmF rRNA methyltransferase first C-terminal domain-containing protein [Defluviitaleaceae bacterium]